MSIVCIGETNSETNQELTHTEPHREPSTSEEKMRALRTKSEQEIERDLAYARTHTLTK